mgnify:CR=1 FL=1
MSTIKSSLNISVSALEAYKAKMDVIAQNIANAETIQVGTNLPYQRRVVSFAASEQMDSFEDYLKNSGEVTPGVQIASVDTDLSPFKMVYDPDNPNADENGYVTMSNVNTTEEMLELLSASRGYEANITVLNTTKNLLVKTLDIGR